MAKDTSTSNLPVDRGWAWVIAFALMLTLFNVSAVVSSAMFISGNSQAVHESYLVTLGHFMNLFFMVGTAKSIGILLQEFHEYFGVSMAVTTLIMSFTGVIYALCAPLCILLGEHFTVRRVVMVGGAVGMVGMALSGLLVNIVHVIIFFGLGFGIGNSTIYGNGLILLGQYFKNRRSLANGLALAGSSIGQFALPPLIQYFLETYALGGTVLLLSGLYFHITFFGSLFRPPSYYDWKPPVSVEEDKFIQSFEVEEKYQNGNLHQKSLIASDGSINKLTENSTLYKERELQALLASTGSIYMGSVGSLQDICRDMDASRIYKDEPQHSHVIKVLKNMFDFSVLKNYICIFYVIISFLAFFGHFNFVIFLPGYALSKGITKYSKALLISICGISDLVGRILFGFIGDLNMIERYKIKGLCLLFVGIDTFVFAFADTYAWISVHTALFGFFGGGYVGMIAVVLIDLIGMEMMPKALAIVLLVQGVGAAAGQPLLGWMKDIKGSYNLVIYVCSSSCVIAGALLLCSSLVTRLEKKRQERVGTVQFNSKEYVYTEG